MKYLVIDLEEIENIDSRSINDVDEKGLLLNALLKYAESDGTIEPEENENIFNAWQGFKKGVYLINKSASEEAKQSAQDSINVPFDFYKGIMSQDKQKQKEAVHEDFKRSFKASHKELYKN